MADERSDPDLLDDEDPFEVDVQAAHLFRHPHLGIDDIRDVRANDTLFYTFYPAKRLAGPSWLSQEGTMLSQVDKGIRALAVYYLTAAGRVAGTATATSSMALKGFEGM